MASLDNVMRRTRQSRKEHMTQIATPEFCSWLETTSFAGILHPGEQWDAETAWPSEDTMTAARKCFDLFMAGQVAEAEKCMHVAQEPFV